MTVAVAVTAAAIVTGNQDITTSDLGGATPKAVVFLYSRAAADGTINAHAGASYGIADATSQYAVATYKHDGLTSWVAAIGETMTSKTDKCITAIWVDGGVMEVHSEAAFVSFIADGVRINWTTASTDGWLITALFFEGADWTVKVGTFTATISPGVSVSTGFQPDAVMLMGANDLAAGSIPVNVCLNTIGFSTWFANTLEETSQSNYGSAITNQQIVYSSVIKTAGRWNIGVGGLYNNSLTRAATSFTAIAGPFSGTANVFGYLALKFTGDGQLRTGKFRLGTGTGDQAFTGFGGTVKQFAFFFLQQITNSNSLSYDWGYWAHTPTKSGGFAVGGVSENFVVGASHPTVMHSTHFTDKVRMLSAAGTENVRATLASYDPDGITLNFTDAPPAACDWFYLTIVGSPAGPGGSSTRGFGWVID